MIKSRMWQMPLMESYAHFVSWNTLQTSTLERDLQNYLCYQDSTIVTLSFHLCPQYLLTRLQNIEFAAASFVYGRYVNDIDDILKLNWLPVDERRDFNLLKLTFKALYFKQWPTYLNLQRVSIRRELRSSDCIRLQVPLEKGTFQDTAALLFNNLPKELKTCDDLNIFISRLFKYLRNRAKTRLQ